MSENGKELLSEKPEMNEKPEKVEKPVMPKAAVVEEPAAEETPPGKPKRSERIKPYLNTVFRWGVGVLIVFGLGVIATSIFVYQPAVQTISELRDELSTANAEIDTLQAQVDVLDEVEAANSKLEDDLAAASLRVLLLSSLADVYAAQFAMETGDSANARVQLTNTPDTLDAMYDRLAPDLQPVVASMQERLSLVLSGIGTDPFAAQSDLEVLANSLISLENSFFTSP